MHLKNAGKWINLINEIMRVRCIESTDSYYPGDVIIVQEEEVLNDIADGILEPFNYTLSDKKIYNLCKKYFIEGDFTKLYSFMIELYEGDRVNNIKLKDGRSIERMFQPVSPEQWLVHNSLHIDYFSKKYPHYTFEGLKEDFFKRLNRVMDTGMFLKKERENLYSWILSHRSRMGCDQLESDPHYVNDSWYDIAVSGMIPISEQEKSEYLSEYLPGGVNEYLCGKALAEYEAFLNAINIKSFHNKQITDETQFSITGIDIPKLVEELLKRNYFDQNDFQNVINWFDGIKPDKPINMSISINYFVSLIADLCDSKPKYIKNTKEYCYTYIERSFLFNGKKSEISYIKKVMKPNSENRVTSQDKTIPDIKSFTTSR